MNVAINNRVSNVITMTVITIVLMFAMMSQAHAGLTVVPSAAPGQVITKTHTFPVWVTETPDGFEMIVNLGVSADDEEAFISRARLFHRSMKIKGCQLNSEGQLNVKRLVVFTFVCVGGVRPDGKVKYIQLSEVVEPQFDINPAGLYLRAHRGWKYPA